MKSLPLPIRVAAGLAVTAVEQARTLPAKIAGLPVTVASQALQVSMRVQQQVTELAIRGDEVLASLRPVEDTPEWATFDEDVEGDEFDRGRSAPFESAFDRVEDELERRNGHLDADDETFATPDPWTQEEQALAEETGALEDALSEDDLPEDRPPQGRLSQGRLSGGRLPEGGLAGDRLPEGGSAGGGWPEGGLAGGGWSEGGLAGGGRPEGGVAGDDALGDELPAAGSSSDLGDDVGADLAEDLRGDLGKGLGEDLSEDVGADLGEDLGRDSGEDLGAGIGGSVGGDRPLPEVAGYDELSLPQLRARLRRFTADELAELLEYERAHGNRPSFVGMLTRRIATVRDQR